LTPNALLENILQYSAVIRTFDEIDMAFAIVALAVTLVGATVAHSFDRLQIPRQSVLTTVMVDPAGAGLAYDGEKGV
jgi:hypothetical protein